ncbi:uncharacterized protein DUF4422 [Desulfitobacterium sp. LBE]|uniref:DUF4422 domain-containing protein n=1 Tax=Desulfitobacterium sp. LBE TaxID=884086 RepID=UPI00119B4056|nr:DUF4422 domain-containing protein [Desulfitobacterium sp. LBE]TWH59744.1 uncharacterized protein DUF4422 [Desulfitobacterium sp. LBE]
MTRELNIEGSSHWEAPATDGTQWVSNTPTQKDIKILIATHKQYRMPADDIYLPIHVGRAGKELNIGIQSDDIGYNISAKNPCFCELTALYWAWKNLQADYIGLAHYRRHFIIGRSSDKWDNILSREILERLLHKTDVVLPEKRNYYIETNYSHYIHGHERMGIDKAIDILKRDYPDYAFFCDKVMKRTWAHMFNMFIMKKDKYDAYCAWIFDILFKLEKEIDISMWSAFEKRVYGRISEMFLDIWVERNKINYAEVPVAFMERQNWLHKGGMFLARKMGVVKRNERF